MTAAHPIGLKIIAVDSEYLAGLEHFGGDDERRVGKDHWAVRIQFHQLEGATQRLLIEIPYGHAAPDDEVTQPIGSQTVGLEYVKGFSEDRYRRADRLIDCAQYRAAARVMLVPGVEKGDQRARVDQYHRPSFLFRARRTPPRVFPEGAIA